MDKEKTITSLKECIDFKEHDLNDWETIFNRRKLFDDEERIYIYQCSFVDIYLYEDGTFFSADPHIPPTRNTDFINNHEFSDDEIKLIRILKSYCHPSEYDLHNWRVILDRMETDDDGIKKFDLAYLTLYLDKDNNYYDAEPQEFSIYDDRDLLSINLNDSDLLKIRLIKRYVLPIHYDLINWQFVLNRCKQVDDNLFLYPLGVMDLYLDNNLNVVDYGRCHIIGDEFWYDFNPHPIVAGEQYTFITNI